jgi:hypothetical protein
VTTWLPDWMPDRKKPEPAPEAASLGSTVARLRACGLQVRSGTDGRHLVCDGEIRLGWLSGRLTDRRDGEKLMAILAVREPVMDPDFYGPEDDELTGGDPPPYPDRDITD